MIPSSLKYINLWTAAVLLTLGACATPNPPRVGTGEDAPTGIGVDVTPEDMEHIRRTVPGGKELTLEKIEAALGRLKPGTGKPTFIPPDKIHPAPTKAEYLRMYEQRRGRELSTLALETLIDGTPTPEKRHAFQGQLDGSDGRVLHLRDDKAGPVQLDFSLTPGLDLSRLSARESVSGAWGKRLTPVGEIAGAALRDGRGLFFVAEVVLHERILQKTDVLPFDVRQNKQDVGHLVRERECNRRYTPDVSVWVGNEELVVTPHSERRTFSYEGKRYMITIVKSFYLEEKSCGVSFEESPWQLEYILRRLDDANEIERLDKSSRVDDSPIGTVYPKDDISAKIKADPEANPEFPADPAPDLVPLWDKERGFDWE